MIIFNSFIIYTLRIYNIKHVTYINIYVEPFINYICIYEIYICMGLLKYVNCMI